MKRANGKVTTSRAGLAALGRAVAIYAAALLFAGADPARAASFTIDPLKVSLEEGRTSTVMRVQNTGKDTLTLQIQARSWQQESQSDRLEPTRELVATPQIFRVKPGATQLVRVALLGKPDTDRETAFRLVFDEIPAPPAADFVGVQVAMRVTIPLFVSPLKTAKPALKVSVRPSGSDKMVIVAENQGNAHAHLKKFVMEGPGDGAKSPLDVEAPAYLLPGTAREFIVSRPSRDSWGKMSIRAIGMTGAVEFDGLAQP